jgi:hypothetical protein
MRINSLFEHDDLMKRQAEQNDNTAPVATMTSSTSNFENSMAEQQVSPPKQNSSGSNSNSGKPAAQRHRASIACASCRDRRIRVSDRFEAFKGWIWLTFSVCCTTRRARLYTM